MKLITFISLLLFSYSIFAAPQTQQVIDIENEIKLIQQKSLAGEQQFKVISINNKSILKEIGYKNGDIIKKINGQTIFNRSQLKAALNSEVEDWESLELDEDFDDVNINDSTFNEFETSL